MEERPTDTDGVRDRRDFNPLGGTAVVAIFCFLAHARVADGDDLRVARRIAKNWPMQERATASRGSRLRVRLRAGLARFVAVGLFQQIGFRQVREQR